MVSRVVLPVFSAVLGSPEVGPAQTRSGCVLYRDTGGREGGTGTARPDLAGATLSLSHPALTHCHNARSQRATSSENGMRSAGVANGTAPSGRLETAGLGADCTLTTGRVRAAQPTKTYNGRQMNLTALGRLSLLITSKCNTIFYLLK